MRSKRQEVNFLVSDERGKPISAIQVSMEISHPDTLRRELEPLVSTATYFGTQENLIITVNQEQHFDKDGVAVHALPAWQWLLQDDVLFQEKDGSRAASPTAGP
jgi:predicted AAA+ superfamily ATPase